MKHLLKNLRNGLIMLGIAVAMLATAELVLRLVFPKLVAPRRPTAEEMAYHFHPDYLVALKPSIQKGYLRTAINGHDYIQWKTNRDSFRGNELRDRPGTRIIVYGDSNVQARFSHLENTFPHRLEQYLGATGRDIEVVNAGVIGFGPDQCLLRFREEVDVYHPDVVIFVLCTDNDYGDIIRNRLFELDPAGKLAQTKHERQVDEQLKPQSLRGWLASLLVTRGMLRELRFMAGASRTDVRPTGHSRLKAYLDAAAREHLIYRKSEPRQVSHFEDRYDIDLALYPESESAVTKVRLMRGILRAAKSLADAKKIKFLVVIQPSAVDLTENTTLSHHELAAYPGYRQDNLTRTTEKICIENGIPYVNLFDVFAQNSPEGLFFRKHNDHWNDAGQELAARVTAGYLQKTLLREANPAR